VRNARDTTPALAEIFAAINLALPYLFDFASLMTAAALVGYPAIPILQLRPPKAGASGCGSLLSDSASRRSWVAITSF